MRLNAERIAEFALPLIVILAVLGMWEVWYHVADVPEYMAAAPSVILRTAATEWQSLGESTLVTIEEAALGLIASVVVGIVLALILDLSEEVRRLITPYLVGSQVVPVVAIAPIIVIWFGYGVLTKVIIVAIFGVFVVAIESLHGLQSIETEKFYLARTMGAGRMATFLKIKIPSALPSIFVGIKLATTLSIIGAFFAEFIGADRGLGYVIVSAQVALDYPTMFAAIVWLTAAGIAAFLAIQLLERRVIHWHISQRSQLR